MITLARMTKVPKKAAEAAKKAAAAEKRATKGKVKPKLEPEVVEAIGDAKAERARLASIYAKRLDGMEKKFNITSTELHIPDRLSSGTLFGDMLMGGGLVAGTMVQISGKEKGGKSTNCMTMLRSALLSNVPIIAYWDAENAMNDPRYAQPIIGKEFPLKTTFYGPAKKARLYQEAVLEDFYNSTKALMRSLPDKRYRSDRKAWFFVFTADPKGRQMMADFGYAKQGYDKELFRETDQLWCETPVKGLQGIVFCDSYPALVPSGEDESEEGSNALALDARAFSKNIKKVKGVLKRKGFVVVGVNQIRLNPGVRMGNPEYEPGGEALKFYSDVRLQTRARAVPQGWPAGLKPDGSKTSEYGTEPSVFGKGSDSYAYVYVQNTKNKTGMPFLASWARIWFRDHAGQPHGYDPVFDTYMYYRNTGRVTGGIKKFKVAIPALKGRVLTWPEFKLLVIAEVRKDAALEKRACKDLGFKKLPTIRADAFKEIRTGTAYDMLSQSVTDADDLEADG